MDDEKLKNIFKKNLSNFEVPPLEEDWYDIDLELNKKRFFKFNFNRFNVYYLGLIIFYALLSTALSIHYFFVGNQHVPSRTQLIRDTVYVNSPPSSMLDSIHSTKKDTGVVKELIQKSAIPTAKKSIQNKSKADSVSVIPGGSVIKNQNATQETELGSSLPKADKRSDSLTVPPKVTYIHKRDTVIVYDTTHVIKKKKKF
jgi:hypothetical protein